MPRLVPVLLAVACCAPPALRADATIRYEQQTKGLPALPNVMPASQTVQVKGNQARVSFGNVTALLDLGRNEITLIDAAHKTYSRIPISQYAAKTAAAMTELPAEAAAMAKDMAARMKTKVESKVTGRTETILGVKAAERELTISLDMPLPEGMPMASMQMKMTAQIWTATPEEALRAPAVRELTALNIWQRYFFDAGAILQALPGGEAGASLIKEASGDQSLILRMNMDLSMPALAGVSDGNTLVMQMKTEAVELSAGPVDAALFQIPGEYAQGSFEELMKAAVQQPAAVAARGVSAPRPDGVQAYVPLLSPLAQEQPPLPEDARAQGVYGGVELLLTLSPQGEVTKAEALAGPKMLRQPAIDAVMKWKFRPVLRGGEPVAALTSATVTFFDPQNPKFPAPNLEETMAADQRLDELRTAMPRSPHQVLADLEQDSGGGNADRRYYALSGLARASLDADEWEKAVAYAKELLAAAGRSKDWNTGNAIHDGNTVLGLDAIRRGDMEKAREHLLASARIEGSPQLNSFGPGMKLAKAMVEKGERDAVLEYLLLCRNFWKMGAQSLDRWAQDVREGRTPNFGMSLR